MHKNLSKEDSMDCLNKLKICTYKWDKQLFDR